MNLQQLQAAHAQAVSRRWFLRDCGVGLGAIAAGSLLTNDLSRAMAAESTNPLAPRQPNSRTGPSVSQGTKVMSASQTSSAAMKGRQAR